MRAPVRSARSALLLVTGVLAVTTACGSSSTSTPSTSAPGSTAAAGGSGAATNGTITISVSAKGCDPQTSTAKAGEITITVKNTGEETAEFEVEKDGQIKAEAENIAPNFTKTVQATLEPGTYELVCGESKNPKGSLVVS